MDILNALKGSRTYLVAALIFVLGGCFALGWIDKSTLELGTTILTGAGLATLRGAIK